MVMPLIVGVVLGSLRSFKGRPAITGKEGMIREVGTVRSPVGTASGGGPPSHSPPRRLIQKIASRF
jgi:hypothetical protein